MKLVPDDSEAHRVRISALMELKRYDEVLASSDAYLARGKPTAEILEIRGLTRVARRDYAAAIVDFNRALELKPEAEPVQRSKLLNLRGWAYQFADAPKLALADFEESLRLEPNQSDAYGGRGLARIRLGQWRPAVTDAESSVRLARAMVPTTGEDRQAQVQALLQRRPDLCPGGRVRRPGSQPPGRAGRRPSIADIAAAPWTCSRRPSSRSPTASAARRS